MTSKQTRQRDLARLRARRDAERRRERRRRARNLYGSLALVIVLAGAAVAIVLRVRGDDPPRPAALDARADAPTAPVAVACGGKIPPRRPKATFDTAPPVSVKPGTTYSARVETSCGDFTMRLDAKAAPKTVSSILFLAKRGFYDSTWFHRIVPGGPQSIGVIQGGDPKGDGGGSPGYRLAEEPPKGRNPYPKYSVAMAKSQQPGTTGSQFFVSTQDNSRGLSPEYTVVGQVTEGSDVVDRIAKVPVAGENRDSPTQAAWIEKLTVTESPGAGGG